MTCNGYTCRKRKSRSIPHTLKITKLQLPSKSKPPRASSQAYRDVDAYRAHLETVHFKKYKATTEKMVKSLKLVQTTPIVLGAKPR